jgi:CRISPR-associated protein Csx17
MTAPLPAVPLPGLRTDLLGGYMAAVGLLRVVSRQWPSVRGAWRDAAFVLIGGPAGIDDLVDHLVGVARDGRWSSYERFWKKEQEKKDPHALACLAAQRTEEEARLLAAHIVPGTRLWFNPLVGSGGNAGKRSFSKGWASARTALMAALETNTESAKKKTATKGPGRRRGRAAAEQGTAVPADTAFADLRGFLGRGDCAVEKDWGAGSWFSQAVETANSGQTPTAKGQVTPWAMLLACEALPMFAGSPSRRLGSRARATAAFPFATDGPAPRSQGEAGKARGEVWLPLWERPMTVPEVRWLFWRARAEVGARGATTPAAFSAAVLRRGTDAGLSGFARFTLASTTGQTFEPRFEGVVATPRRGGGAQPGVEGRVVETVLRVFEQLPRDRKVGKRWRVPGYRAPIERALIARAADPASPGTARALLDAFVQALDRADRSQPVRKRGLRWQLLPCDWLPALFGDEMPSLEARLAMGAASLLPTGDVPAFAAYRFGLDLEKSFARHPQQPPPRWVWRTLDVVVGLAALMLRRLVDAGASRNTTSSTALPFWAAVRVSLADVVAWLRGDLDELLLGRWIGRMALFDWRALREASKRSEQVRRVVAPQGPLPAVDADLAAYGLLRPLFDPRTIVASDGGALLAEETGARTVAAARQVAAMLSGGAFGAAFDVAQRRYATGMRPLAEMGAPLPLIQAQRLLAALVFAAPRPSIAQLAERFLRPTRAEYKERIAWLPSTSTRPRS